MRKEQIILPLIRNVVQRPKLADVLFRFDRWGNPFTADVYRDPYPSAERIRADGPVSYRALYQQWFVCGYEEAKQILASDEVVVGEQIDVLLDTRPYNKLSDRSKFLFRHFLLVQDPPDHGRLRRLVSKAFTPMQVSALEPRIQAIAEDLLDDLAGDDQPDLAESFNVKLPVNVIADMMGLPPNRWEWARSATQEMVKLLDPFVGFDPDQMNAAIDEVFEYYGALADERRAEPEPDLISALVAAEDDGERLSRDELVVMIAFLIGAGYETTAGLLGNALLALADHPDERAKLLADPDLWPNAIEELVRFDTSVKRDPRHTTADIEVGGVTIPAGSNVLIVLEGANRDPRRYDDPNTLKLDRQDPRPISFGHGIHHCLGASLARMELRIGLAAVLDRFGEYTIDEEQVQWKASTTLRGPTYLPVRPAAALLG